MTELTDDCEIFGPWSNCEDDMEKTCGFCGTKNNAHHSAECVDRETNYKSLRCVLNAAFDQAASGKGKERHASGEPFEKQKICEITRRVGFGYPLGQAIKKSEESQRLDTDAGIRELLGAINYLAAAVIVMQEKLQGRGDGTVKENDK